MGGSYVQPPAHHIPQFLQGSNIRRQVEGVESQLQSHNLDTQQLLRQNQDKRGEGTVFGTSATTRRCVSTIAYVAVKGARGLGSYAHQQQSGYAQK